MPYANIEDQRRANREWRAKYPEKARAACAKWAKANAAKKQELNRKCIGAPGTPEREAYNEKRRVWYKKDVLQELEAARKHKASLRAFITGRVL